MVEPGDAISVFGAVDVDVDVGLAGYVEGCLELPSSSCGHENGCE